MADTDGITRAHELGGWDGFASESDAYYLLPDAVHGNQERYDLLVQKIRDPGGRLDRFGDAVRHAPGGPTDLPEAADGSPEFAAAEAELLGYYETNWNTQFGLQAPRDNHYFRILSLARESGKGAYALDADLDYMFFRYSEFPLGSTTRNVVWADQLPREGRGLLFGGSAHMILGQKGTVQDFIAAAVPGARIYHHYVDSPPGS